MVPRCVAVALAGAMLQSVESGRIAKHNQANKLIANVPIHNYDLRTLQLGPEQTIASASVELDWVLSLSGSWTEDQLAEFCRGSACRSMGHPDKGGLPYATIRSTEDGLQKFLSAHPGQVGFVEPDLPVYVVPGIEEVGAQSDSLWGHDVINLAAAKHTGKGVHIFVMDTGIRTTHEDFGGRAVPTVDTILGSGVAVECDPADTSCSKDKHGHGTHVAGTAGGSNYGVATDAIMHSMRVCCGSGTNTMAGMDYILMKGERPAVMTMSLGSSGTSQMAKTAVDALVMQGGVTVTVSAGNNDIDACRKTYAFIDSAISVGSTAVGNSRSWFSNWGSCVDIWAPGSDILSAGHMSDDAQRKMSGTSMATPAAAGVVALLVEEFPEFDPVGIRQELLARATVDAVSDLKDSDANLLLSVV